MSHDKKMLDREAVRSVIQQWNANRLDLFALSEPDESLLFHGVMRFYFQDAGQKVATKCIRVASDATVSDVIATLIEKFRPDMRMLSVPNYALYEVHANGDERRLNHDEKPLLVQLNWHIDDREGRFLLKNIDQKTTPIEAGDMNFKRKLSKREKKEQKKKEKHAKLNATDAGSVGNRNSNSSHATISGGVGTHPSSISNNNNNNNNNNNSNSSNGGMQQLNNNGHGDETQVAGKLYTELPETSFTRSISNPEAVMRRRRQLKLEKKLQQFRSRDGGPDTGGTLKIYGESLCPDVPYKTLLLSIRDCAQAVVREMLTKYGLEKADPLQYCLVQVNSDGKEYILDDDECPLSILMNHPTSRGSIMFHVRRRPADSQPRRRKKKPLGAANGSGSVSGDRDGPVLVEITHTGDGGRRLKLGSDPVEVGSANTNSLQLFGPSIQPRHCLISLLEGVCTVTPLHTDALTFVNGHHITQPTILHNGSVVMFGRVASYRFLDSPTDGRYNLALSQSQLDSACLYESRSPASPTSPASPGSWIDDDCPLSSTNKSDFVDAARQPLQQQQQQQQQPQNYQHEQQQQQLRQQQQQQQQQFTIGNNNIGEQNLLDGEPNCDGGTSTGSQQIVEGNLENETKSISSLKSSGSNSQERLPKMPSASISADNAQGQEPILPAVLEFPETHQDLFLQRIIVDLDVNIPHFKLAPVYSLYLCARYRASTHYRPELQPTERAHKLTIFLHHVAKLIYSVVQEQYTDPRILAFWMANSSEFLHFLKSDRHICAFSLQAQELLAEAVQIAFRNLVNCFRVELSQSLNQFLCETISHDSAAGLVLTVLGSAMALLRRCRVNAGLTIQLFSQIFHFINVFCFNKIVTNTQMCTAEWGNVMSERLQRLEIWAERQGLEIAVECHLSKINQCAQFLQAPKTNVEEMQQLACSCFRLNSLQMAALLQQEKIPRNLADTAVRMAESVADELTRADGREVRLEESPELHLALLLPDDGFSCDVVRGIPTGLVDFLNPLQQQGMCRLAAQPTSIGLWTVYMHQFGARSSSAMSNKQAQSQPVVQIIQLQKNTNGMGLSIVAAKGSGQDRLGIYIKSVVPGGAADADGRLEAGDQLLRVDGQSLIGISQERAADYLVRTGPVVTLEVAKNGANYNGLDGLLLQPSPVMQRAIANAKSRSTHSLHNSTSTGGNNNNNNNDQGFYQNLSVYRAQNQSQPALNERSQISSQFGTSMHNGSSQPNISSSIHSPANGSSQLQQQQLLHQKPQQQGPNTHGIMNAAVNSNVLPNRPVSAYYHSNTAAATAVAAAAGNPILVATTNNNNAALYQQQQQQQQFAQHGINISASNTNLNSALTMQQQQQQQQLHLQQQQLAQGSLTMNNRGRAAQANFNRDMQLQHSLRMQQMMAPSMPNMSNIQPLHLHHHQHQQQQQHQILQQQLSQQQMSGSQSMQNVNANVTDGIQTNGTDTQQQQQQQHSPATLMLRRNPRHDIAQYGNNAESAQHSPNQPHVGYHHQQQQQQQQQQQLLQQQTNFIALPPKPIGQQHQFALKPQQLAPPSTAPKPLSQTQHRLQQLQQFQLQTQQQHQQQQQQHHQQQQQQQQQQQPYMLSQVQSGDDKPPLPPTATHPLYKVTQQLVPGMNYVASSVDPPKGSYLPASHGNQQQLHQQLANQQQKNFIGGNPWDREEREKEVQLRREHLRQWREQQITELSSLQQRTPQQEEQLKTLILERDFERRAQEVVEEHEEESEMQYEKDNVQELYRLATTGTAIQTPMTNFRQTEIKIASVLDNVAANSNYNNNNNNNTSAESSPRNSAAASTATAATATNGNNGNNNNEQQSANVAVNASMLPTSSGSTLQPKSILKNNRYTEGNNGIPSSPSKAIKSTSFADDRHRQIEHPISSLSKDLTALTLSSAHSSNITNNNNNGGSSSISNDVLTAPPPPPPERNSSYLIMSQQKLRNSVTGTVDNNAARRSNNMLLNNNSNVNNNNGSNTLQQQQSLGVLDNAQYLAAESLQLLRDNKRVSFNDESDEPLAINHQQQQQQQFQAAELDAIEEDTSYLEHSVDASTLPSMPATPDAALWNTSVQSTPGVIGAQEVYRDPRQRRLAEKQQQQQQQRSTEAVPEKLSFKEKMKMFALESGENRTPKDKLKISRAQRDIDAVH